MGAMCAPATDSSRPACCPPGSHGYLSPAADYVERGTVETLGDLEVYVVAPPPPASDDDEAPPPPLPQRLLIVGYDIFGFNSGRTRQICDELASRGYLVMLPDFFRGGGANGDVWMPFAIPSMISTIKSTAWSRVCADISTALTRAAAMTSTSAAAPLDVGFLGFCWGGWAAARATGAPEFLHENHPDINIVAAALVHPSLRAERMCGTGLTESEIVNAVSCPTLLLASSNEPASVKEDGTSTLAIKANYPATKAKTYPAMSHGWVPRGDLSNVAVQRDANDAMAEIVAFFGAQFSPAKCES